MATNEDVGGGLLAGGAVLLALVAAAVAFLRGGDGGDRVINIPSDFGSDSGSSNDFAETGDSSVTTPADEMPDSTPSGEWDYQSPDDNPENSDFDYDFGGPVATPPDSDDPDNWTPDDATNDPTETRDVDGEDEIWDSPAVTDPTPDDDSGSSGSSGSSWTDDVGSVVGWS